MKVLIVAALALACVLGLAPANNYGYGGYGGVSGGGLGNGGLLMLIGLLFLLMFLFNPNQRSTATTLPASSVTFINATSVAG